MLLGLFVLLLLDHFQGCRRTGVIKPGQVCLIAPLEEIQLGSVFDQALDWNSDVDDVGVVLQVQVGKLGQVVVVVGGDVAAAAAVDKIAVQRSGFQVYKKLFGF